MRLKTHFFARTNKSTRINTRWREPAHYRAAIIVIVGAEFLERVTLTADANRAEAALPTDCQPRTL